MVLVTFPTTGMSTSGRSRTVSLSTPLTAFGSAFSRTVIGSPRTEALRGVVPCEIGLVGRSPGAAAQFLQELGRSVLSWTSDFPISWC